MHINNIELMNSNDWHFISIQTVISQKIAKYQIIIQILDRIETAVSFSKQYILHNSIVEDLLYETRLIENILRNDYKLPFTPILENIVLCEEIDNYIQCPEIKIYNLLKNAFLVVISQKTVSVKNCNGAITTCCLNL